MPPRNAYRLSLLAVLVVFSMAITGVTPKSKETIPAYGNEYTTPDDLARIKGLVKALSQGAE